ncbi:hypothetical protein SLS62_009636 [Diatrype stigma]|uniref:SGNH hydrolase-type esterase domain-containing protein n=1 Tax=Diatrype stigma TaxID=117547 RepID=A0AAN9UK70_9PEZI
MPPPHSHPRRQPPPKQLHIASIGSSFAAGPSIEPVANRFAARSGANYASLLAARVGARLTDLAVSGATLRNLLSEPQAIPDPGLGPSPEPGLASGLGGYRFAPQVEQLPPDADIVLVLAGGDDLGYVGGLLTDTANSHWIGRFITPVADQSASALPSSDGDDGGGGGGGGNGSENESSKATATPIPLDEAALADSYGAVLDAVHARVPGALVLAVEYLTMLGPDARPGTRDVPFAAERAAHHRRVAVVLQRATARAVMARQGPGQNWCVLVPVTEPSKGHGLGARNAWVSGFSWRLLYSGGAYHPNAEGMKAVAEILYWKLFELGRVGG